MFKILPRKKRHHGTITVHPGTPRSYLWIYTDLPRTHTVYNRGASGEPNRECVTAPLCQGLRVPKLLLMKVNIYQYYLFHNAIITTRHAERQNTQAADCTVYEVHLAFEQPVVKYHINSIGIQLNGSRNDIQITDVRVEHFS